MSFKSELSVAGKKYKVVDLRMKLARSIGPTGISTSQTRGGQVIITVESTGDSSLMEWMCDSFRTEDGQVDFYRADQNSISKSINWEQGYCVKYEQNYNATSKTTMLETFTVSAKAVSIGTGRHENDWTQMG